MNRIERQIRNMVNPYSTAFAGWWCHSARYLPLVRMISGARGVSRRRMRMMNQAQMLYLQHSAAEMAARRAAVDAVIARLDKADS
jgi:hypothetical protein